MSPRRLVRRLGRRLSQSKRSSRKSLDVSGNTAHAPLGSQKNPAHILTRDTPIGWTVIQKAVDEFDKDQIEGVKNDVDTLLVFIGLFSAVLSSFLVVAVALLQEDIPGATLTTLRQMSVQNVNYTIQGDFIYSTSPAPTSSPPFKPSANAVRINDLWAASLIISLGTASFGILVKQWLREYMKFVTSFPQGRLRIRKFRRAGLETWKVLTIAACLPLLLQLALGLFFVGLCFYTAELHSSVRNTTLPLVAGWGFIFFFVTVSPLFSAHCPYKTPALDSLVVALRPCIRASLLTLWTTLMKALKNLARYISIKAPTYSTVERVAYMVSVRADGYIARLKNPKGPYNETTAATYEASDLEIMVDADELQGNDEIVGTAMVDALQHVTAPPQDVIEFMMKILQHRVQWEGNFKSKPQIIDCSMATTRALDSIHSILQRHLPLHSVVFPPDSVLDLDGALQRLASWTVCLHLSLWTHHGFRRVTPPPWEPLERIPDVFVKFTVSALPDLGLEFLLHLTCQWCRESKLDLIQSLARIKSVVEPFFDKIGLIDSFESHDHNSPRRTVLNKRSLRDTVVFLTDLLHDDTTAHGGEWSEAHYDALSYTIKLIAVEPWEFTHSLGAVRLMVTSSHADAPARNLLTSLIKSYPRVFHLYTRTSRFETDIKALSRVRAAIETITTDHPDQMKRVSVLKTCRSLAESVYKAGSAIKNTDLTESWRMVFAALTALVLVVPVPDGGTDEEAAQIKECFHWVDDLNVPNRFIDHNDEWKYLAWRTAFKPERSPIPDGFYLTLMQISIPETPLWRVRRLQEMTPEDRERAAKDIEPHLRKSSAVNLDNSTAGPSTGRSKGSGVGVGAATGGAGAPGEGGAGRHSGDESETVTGGPQPHTDAALVSGSDGRGPEADASHDDEQDTVTFGNTAGRIAETAALPDGDPMKNVPSVADNPDVTVEVHTASRDVDGGERAGTILVDEHTSG